MYGRFLWTYAIWHRLCCRTYVYWHGLFTRACANWHGYGLALCLLAWVRSLQIWLYLCCSKVWSFKRYSEFQSESDTIFVHFTLHHAWGSELEPSFAANNAGAPSLLSGRGSLQVRSLSKLQHRPSSPPATGGRQRSAARAGHRRRPAAGHGRLSAAFGRAAGRQQPAAAVGCRLLGCRLLRSDGRVPTAAVGGRRQRRSAAAADRRRSAAVRSLGPGRDRSGALVAGLAAALEADGLMKWSWFYSNCMPNLCNLCAVYMPNMQKICKKYAENKSRYAKYAKTMQKLCKCRPNMQKYAKNMQKLCNKYATNMQFMSGIYFAYICKICTYMQNMHRAHAGCQSQLESGPGAAAISKKKNGSLIIPNYSFNHKLFWLFPVFPLIFLGNFSLIMLHYSFNSNSLIILIIRF